MGADAPKRRVFLSFLGTFDYTPSMYYYEKSELSDPANWENFRFIQEKLLKSKCADWNENDGVYIFCTEAATKKNWENDEHTDCKTGAPKTSTGLGERLEMLGLTARYQKIDIPSGENENEIWEIFKKVYKRLERKDEVTFDITHAFRSIPMLAIVVLNYARVLKDITVANIYYGAFEARVKKEEIPDEAVAAGIENAAPVFDLTSFVTLMDWTLAFDRFLKSGDASAVRENAIAHTAPILRETRGRDRTANALKKVAGKLRDFTDVMATCRGQDIDDATADVRDVLRELERVVEPEGSLLPFQPLLEMVKARMDKFDGSPVEKGVEAARWCLEHNMVQQGITILREVLITHVLQAADGGSDIEINTEKREFASRALLSKSHDAEKGGPEAERHPEQLDKRLKAAVDKMGEVPRRFRAFGEYRNDINHAGMRENAMSPVKFREKLKEMIELTERVITQR